MGESGREGAIGLISINPLTGCLVPGKFKILSGVSYFTGKVVRLTCKHFRHRDADFEAQLSCLQSIVNMSGMPCAMLLHYPHH